MTPNPWRAFSRVLFSVFACVMNYPQARRFVKTLNFKVKRHLTRV